MFATGSPSRPLDGHGYGQNGQGLHPVAKSRALTTAASRCETHEPGGVLTNGAFLLAQEDQRGSGQRALTRTFF